MMLKHMLLAFLLLLGSAAVTVTADVDNAFCAGTGACTATYTVPAGIVSLDIFRRGAVALDNQQFTIDVTSGDVIAIAEAGDGNWNLDRNADRMVTGLPDGSVSFGSVALSSGNTSPLADVGEWVLSHYDECDLPESLEKTLSVRMVGTSGLKNIGGVFVLQLTVEMPGHYTDVAMSFNHQGLFGSNALLTLLAKPDQCLGDATTPASTWGKIVAPDMVRTEVPNSCLATYTVQVEYGKYCQFDVDKSDPSGNWVFSGTVYVAGSTALQNRPLTDIQEVITPLNWQKTLITTVTVETDITVDNPDICTLGTCGATHTCNMGIGTDARVCGTGYEHVCRSDGGTGFNSICASAFSPFEALDIHPTLATYTGDATAAAFYDQQCTDTASRNRCDCSAHGYAEVADMASCGPDITPPLWGNCPNGATTLTVAASSLTTGQPLSTFWGSTVGGVTNPGALSVFDNSLETLTISGGYAGSESWATSAYTAALNGLININLASTTVTLTVTDTTSLTATCVVTITIVDDILPVLICPANLSGDTVVAYTRDWSTIASIVPTVTDDSGETLIPVTVTSFTTSPSQGLNTIRYTATDSGGNTGECSFLVYFDNIAPTHPSEILVDIGTLGIDLAYDEFGTITYTDPPTAHEGTDACFGARLAADACTKQTLIFYTMDDVVAPAPGSPSQHPLTTGVSTIGYFRVVDSLGNVSEKCFLKVKVVDDQDPNAITDQNEVTDVMPTAPGQNYALLPDISSALDSNDNVAVVTTVLSIDGVPVEYGDQLPMGTTTITLTVWDAVGRSDSATLTITVVDLEDPVTNVCPADMTVLTGSSSTTWLAALASFSTPTYTDNVTAANALALSMVLKTSAGTVIPIGTQLAPGAYSVTWTAEDEAGNDQSLCSYDITVQGGDGTGPVITNCVDGGAIVHATQAGVNYWNPSSDMLSWITQLGATGGTAVLSETVNDTTYSDFLTTGQPVSADTVIYTYIVTDVYGNTSQCEFTITVVDQESPTIDCSALVPTGMLSSLPYAEGTNYKVPYGFDFAGFALTPTTGDNVDLIVTAVATLPLTSVAIGAHGLKQYTYKWTAVDVAANPSVTCQIQIEEVDVTPAAVDCTAIPGLPMAYVTGSSDGWTGSFTALTMAALQTANAASDDLALKSVSILNSLGNDANGFNFLKAPNTVGPTEHTLTLRAIDYYNVATTCTFTITVQDNEKPNTACPTDKTVSITDSHALGTNTWGDLALYHALIGGALVWTDNVDASGVGLAVTGDLSLPLSLGETTITSLATDKSGNFRSCSFKITVLDGQKPSGACPENYPNAISTAGSGIFDGDWIPTALSFADNDAVDSIAISDTYTLDGQTESTTATILYGAALGAGAHQITITVKDAALNTHTCIFTILVDSEGPAIQCPPSSTQYITAGDTVTYTIPNPPAGTLVANPWSLLGDISASLTLCLVEGDACNAQSTTATWGLGTFTLRWTADDGAHRSPARSESCEFTVIVEDLVAPVFTSCGGPTSPISVLGSVYTVGVTAPSNTYVGGWAAAVATENLPGPVLYSMTSTADITQSSALAIGTHQVTYSAVDQYGNQSLTCTFTIIVVDNIPPTLDCARSNFAIPADGIVGDDAGENYYTGDFDMILGQTDNIGIISTTLIYDDNGTDRAAHGFHFLSGAPSGQLYTLTLTATDGSGNTNSCSMTILVKDLENPGSNYTGATQPDATALLPKGVDAVASPCLGSTSTYSGAWFTGTDAALTTTDNVEVATVQYAVSHPLANSGAFADMAINSPLQLGINTIRCTITDTSNNVSVRFVTILVADIVDPTLTCPPNFTLTLPAANSATAVTVSAADGGKTFTGSVCDDVDANSSMTPTNALYTDAHQLSTGSYTVGYDEADVATNNADCITVVTVIDATPPAITLVPDNIVVDCSTGNCVNNARTVTFAFTVENNGPSTITTTNAQGQAVTSDGTYFPIGITTVTITASDATFNGPNAATATFTVEVYDNIAPTVTCPADMAQPVAYHEGVAAPYNIIAHNSVRADANCGSGTGLTNVAAVVDFPAQNPHHFGIGTHTVQYTTSQTVATCGFYTRVLQNTCQFTITITDTVNPIPDTCLADFTIGATANGGPTYQGAAVTFTDNHYTTLAVTRTSPSASGDITLAVGANTITYQAVDGSGNIGYCTTVVTFVEDRSSEITCPLSLTLPMDPGLSTAAYTFTIGAQAFGDTSVICLNEGTDACLLPLNGASLTGTTGTAIAAVALGTADSYVILTKAGITTTGATSITGAMATSPIAATAMTGFGLVLDATGTFSTSSLVSGNIHAASYAAPTPATLTVAVLDMQAAYTAAMGRAGPDHVEYGAGSIEGATLTAGLYKWATGVGFTTGVTLHGSPTDVFIFQISGILTVGSAATVTLTGGAQASNVFWAVIAATLGTTSSMQGVILSSSAVTCATGASVHGAVYAQTALTLDACTITKASYTAPGAAPGGDGEVSASLSGPWAGGATVNTMHSTDNTTPTAGTDTCDFTVTVVDTEEPTNLVCPGDISIRASNIALPDTILLSSLTAGTGTGTKTLSGASFDAPHTIGWEFSDNYSASGNTAVTFDIPDLSNGQLGVGAHDVWVIATDEAGNSFATSHPSACKFVLTVLPTYDWYVGRDVYLSKVFIQQLSTSDGSLQYGAYIELKTTVPWPHKLRKVAAAGLFPGKLELHEVIGDGCAQPATGLDLANPNTAAECEQTFSAVIDLPPGCAPVSQVYSFQLLDRCDDLPGNDDCTQIDIDWIIDATLRADNYCSVELADVDLTAVLITLSDAQMVGFGDAQALALPTQTTNFYDSDTVNGVLVVSSPDVELTTCTLIDVRRLPDPGIPDVLFTTEVFGSAADATATDFTRDTANHVFWTKFTFPTFVDPGGTETTTLSATVALEYNLGGTRRRRLMTIKMMVSADGTIANGSRKLMQAAGGSGSGDAAATSKYVTINNPLNVDAVQRNAEGTYSFVIARMVHSTVATMEEALAYVQKIQDGLNAKLRGVDQTVTVSLVRVDGFNIIVSIGHDGTLAAVLRNHIADEYSSFNRQLEANVGSMMDPQFFYEGDISGENTTVTPTSSTDSMLPIMIGAAGGGACCFCILFFLLCKRRKKEEDEIEQHALDAKNRDTGVPTDAGLVISSRRFSFSHHSSVAPADVLHSIETTGTNSGDGSDQNPIQNSLPVDDSVATNIHRRISWSEDECDDKQQQQLQQQRAVAQGQFNAVHRTSSAASIVSDLDVVNMLESPRQ